MIDSKGPRGPLLFEVLEGSTEMIDFSRDPLVQLDIRYASENNFTGRNLYGSFQSGFLHPEAAVKFRRAQAVLAQTKPGYKFLVFDCLRPRSIQRMLWDVVKGTPQEKYVANPDEGSIHNYGFAIDLSLVDEAGRELDMGTPYDYFGDLAEPAHERRFLEEGLLTEIQNGNRLLLRQVMTAAGFTQLPFEWWHYDGLSLGEIKKRGYKIVE